VPENSNRRRGVRETPVDLARETGLLSKASRAIGMHAAEFELEAGAPLPGPGSSPPPIAAATRINGLRAARDTGARARYACAPLPGRAGSMKPPGHADRDFDPNVVMPTVLLRSPTPAPGRAFSSGPAGSAGRFCYGWRSDLKRLVVLFALLACGSAQAAPAKPAIQPAAQAAIEKMGQTLQARQFAFTAATVRVYSGPKGEPLHIFHKLAITVRRPDRLLVQRSGDDGAGELVYDGKTAFIYSEAKNEYAKIPAPPTIDAMMREVIGRLHVDFPLADLLTNDPARSFLSGVATGERVGNVVIDGASCSHLFFTQPPGIEIELWTTEAAPVVPRRLIVTYRNLPGVPYFIAAMGDWNFQVPAPDSLFAFQPPAGAKLISLPQPKGAR
jgi:hypothetical protein